MKKPKILFIEDDSAGREVGIFNLKKAGYDAHPAGSGEEGLELFKERGFDLVITDVKMPGISGMDVLAEIKRQWPQIPVLVITAYADVDTAVEAMKAGAFDFIGKPFNRDHLLLSVEKALERRRLLNEVNILRIEAGGVERKIVYQSRAMKRMLEMADRFAVSDATVLITGQSGTGKELVARRIHTHSKRANGPFVAVNCAAIPEQLMESELFGHKRGAFTGADRDREGKFLKADGGTLFLDEIGELPPSMQGKLLRVLQERLVDSVGSDEHHEVDVRVIAATNKNLEDEVNARRFRDDLYYRINVVQVEIPSLANRKEDIEPLAKHFVAMHSKGTELSIPDHVIEVLCQRQWPGNVRQLENVCQRLAILATGNSVTCDDLPGSPSKPNAEESAWPPMPRDGLSLLDLEKSVIKKVLDLKKGNVTQTAIFLKIPRHVLAYRMEKYGIERKK